MDEDRIWHPYTRQSAYADSPLPVLVRGEGPYLFDAAGRRYLDAISSWWAAGLGHSHPRLLAALRHQAASLQHSILGNLSHPPALELAARLSELTGGRRHVHFASDGAAAIEAALKIAFQYWHNRGVTSRTTFASLAEPYHGDTLGAVSVGFMESFHRVFRPLLFSTQSLPFPDCIACGFGRDRATCPAACANAAIAHLREAAPSLAAVVVEPLCQGAAGMRFYGPGFLRRLAEICRELDVLLIVDEIATGFYRTGARFAHDRAGIRPDIVCLGKALSGGMLPISAAVVDDGIFGTFADQPVDHTFYHGHTFAGNPLAAAVANEALAIYGEPGFAERIGELAATIRQRLDITIPGAITRTLGVVGAVEFTTDDGPARARRARQHLFDQGILARPLGPVLYIMPPYILADDQLAELCDRFVEAARNT